MQERTYDPVAYSNAMTAFKENLRQSSPEAFDILFGYPCVGFSHKPEAFEWTFLPFNSEDKYERLSAGPLFDALGAAAKAARIQFKAQMR